MARVCVWLLTEVGEDVPPFLSLQHADVDVRPHADPPKVCASLPDAHVPGGHGGRGEGITTTLFKARQA